MFEKIKKFFRIPSIKIEEEKIPLMPLEISQTPETESNRLEKIRTRGLVICCVGFVLEDFVADAENDNYFGILMKGG